MTCNEDQRQLERFKQKLEQKEVDLSNGLCKISNKNWKYFQKIKKLSRVQILHFQRNQNSSLLIQISHIKFVNLKRLILQSNKILNIEILEFFDFPNLQELDLLKNKISNIKGIQKWKITQLSVLKLSVDSIGSGWTEIFRGQMNLKFMILDSFYSKKNPIIFSKLIPMIKSVNVNEFRFKNNQKKETNHLIQYLKDFKVKKK